MAGAVVRVSFDLWLQRLEDPRQERSRPRCLQFFPAKLSNVMKNELSYNAKKYIMQANFKSRIVEQNI